MSDFWVENYEVNPQECETADGELVARLLEMRPSRADLSDDEFIKEAGFLIIRSHVAPVLRDALGLNGDENQAKMFPLANVLARLGHDVTADFVALQEGMRNE